MSMADLVKTTAVRRIVWVLVGVACYALIGMLTPAKAQAYTTQAKAAQACEVSKNKVVAGVNYANNERCVHEPNRTPYKAYVCYADTANGTFTCGAFGVGAGNLHDYGTSCPTATTVNVTTGNCDQPCTGQPPLANTWVANAVTTTSVCKNNCGFVPPSGVHITPCQTVDGVQYCRVDGYVPNAEVTCAADGSSNNNFGTPPSDGDSDGISDGNDGSPNNPGQDAGGLGEPGGNGEDGSGACGAAGQPACPEGGLRGPAAGEGSGNGNTSGGGGNCQDAPRSSGDAIGAMAVFQIWKVRCALEGVISNGKVQTGTSGGSTGGGTGDGDENQGTAGWGGCTPQGSPVAFVCTNDPVGCFQAERAAVAACRDQAKDSDNDGQPDWMQGDEPDIAGDGDGDAEEPEFGMNVGVDLLDTSSIFGSGGSCANFSFTILGNTVSTANFDAWCNLQEILRAVIMFMGAFAAIKILLGR